ncbi:flagellar hook-length control protein FliK [Pseudoalteromonas sp. YIC-656]|uniref:flagellar hook-length control protein FliK n=1 Tax=Pseudoalteromonas pernae TaxID=3118054 RepID=UPI003241DE2D
MSGPFAPLNNLSIQLQIAGSSGQNQQSIELPVERPIAARNIHIQAQQLSMEVNIQGRWQNVSVPLKSPQSALIGLEIDAANLQIKADGSVSIKPAPINLPLDKAQQLMTLLASVTGQQSALKTPSNPVQLEAKLQGAQTISLAQLSASFHIDKGTAQLLKNASQLVALELSVQQGKLISQLLLSNGARIPAPLTTDKLSQALIKASPALQIAVPPSQPQADISLTKEQGAVAALMKILSVPLTRSQFALLAGPPTPANLQVGTQGQLQLQVPPVAINLKTALDTKAAGSLTLLSGTKANSPQAAPVAPNQPFNTKVLTNTVTANQLLQPQEGSQTTSSQSNSLWQRAQQHLQIWQTSLANKSGSFPSQSLPLSTSQLLLKSPVSALLSPLLQISLARPTTHIMGDKMILPSQVSQLLALKNQFAVSEPSMSQSAALTTKVQHPLAQTRVLTPQHAATALLDAIPTAIKTKAPLLALIVQMQNVLKGTVVPTKVASMAPNQSAPLLNSPLLITASEAKTLSPNLLTLPTNINSSLSQALTPLPLTARLMAPLIKQFAPAQQLSQHISNLDKALNNAPVELKNMVNQAFSRMMNVAMPAPMMSAQVMAHLQPQSLSAGQYQMSFAGQIDALVSTLASSAIISAQPQFSQSAANTALMPLINLLLGQSPTAPAADTLMQQLQSPAAQALLADLNFLQQSMSPQASAQQALNQQDSNPLVQLFLPMRLPPDVGQTHLALGRYKQKNNKGEYQDVWFVRMQFDYAKLGELSVQAHLCKQTLNCELRANTSQLANLAKQHSDDLRRNLQQHGLGVAQIKVEKVSEQQAQQWQKFYKRHSIVNLKV